MTEDELTRLEELARAATPGIWFFAYRTVHSQPATEQYMIIERTIPGDAPEEAYKVLPDTAVAHVQVCGGDTAKAQGLRDGEFIAAAREAVPALIDQLRSTRTLAKEWERLRGEAYDLYRDAAAERDTLRALADQRLGEADGLRHELADITSAYAQARQGQKHYADRCEHLEGETSRLHNAATLIADERNAAARDRDALRDERSIWRCDTHHDAAASGWGCPDCVAFLRQENGRLRAEVERINSRLREIADEVLGLQPVDVPAVDLLDGMERAYHRERIEKINTTAEVERMRPVVESARDYIDFCYGANAGREPFGRDDRRSRLRAALAADGSSSGGKTGGG